MVLLAAGDCARTPKPMPIAASAAQTPTPVITRRVVTRMVRILLQSRARARTCNFRSCSFRLSAEGVLARDDSTWPAMIFRLKAETTELLIEALI